MKCSPKFLTALAPRDTSYISAVSLISDPNPNTSNTGSIPVGEKTRDRLPVVDIFSFLKSCPEAHQGFSKTPL